MKEKNITRLSADDLRQKRGQTDWDRLQAAPDHEGAAEINVDWTRAEITLPEPKKLISLRIDSDIVEFFRAQGKGYQTKMNAVLRAYKDAQEKV